MVLKLPIILGANAGQHSIFQKPLFNGAPRIKCSIPDNNWLTGRPLACYIILRDCSRCCWCTAATVFAHASLASTASTCVSCPRALSGCRSHSDVPNQKCQGTLAPAWEASVTTDGSWSTSASALSPLSWGRPECVFSSLLWVAGASSSYPRMATGHLYWLLSCPTFSALQQEVSWGHLPN